MKKIQFLNFFALTFLLLVASKLNAQTPSNSTPQKENPGYHTTNSAFWSAKLTGGKYIARLSSVNSVAKHAYVLSGGMQVTEVTIETDGSALARFYYIEPVGVSGGGTASGFGKVIADRAGDITDRGSQVSGVNANEIVTKEYPITTHAKTIEYRLGSLKELEALFESIQKSLMEQQGRDFKIAGARG